jgi:hypothetical protein
VTGVTSNEFLHVRDVPSANSRRLADIPPHAHRMSERRAHAQKMRLPTPEQADTRHAPHKIL